MKARYQVAWIGLALAATAWLPPAPCGGAEKPDLADSPVRTDPALKETAEDLKLPVWINPALPKESKPELLWVRAVWGMTEANLYRNWTGQKKEWAAQPNWYFVWPGLARFKGRLIVAFQENNRPHTYGDTVEHVIVSEDDGATWRSVAHYECPSPSRKQGAGDNLSAGFAHGYFTPASDGRLMLSGRSGMVAWAASAFSDDGLAWGPLKKWLVKGELGNTGEIFRPAWCGNWCYGLSRPGAAWKSPDGANWEPVKVLLPEDGKVCGNESASTFVGDRWVGFMRSGMISSSTPPYTHWDINVTNVRGPHSHGGPNTKALPTGQVLTGSRGAVPNFGSNLATIFEYDGKGLTPMAAFHSGATGTGYPGFAWEDGHLWMVFMISNPKAKGEEGRARGLVTVAKFKWPVPAGARSVSAAYEEAHARREKDAPKAELAGLQRIGDQAAHSGYTDLIRFRDKWLCCFREGDDGVVFGCRPEKNGQVRVLTSTDGAKWTPAALLAEEGVDLRDPRLSVAPDGRVMLLAAGAVLQPPAATRPKARTVAPTCSRVAFSKDGLAWTDFQKVALAEGDKTGEAWISRVTWREGTAYAQTRGGAGGRKEPAALVSSPDGVNYRVVNGPRQRKVAPTGRYAEEALMRSFGGEETAIRFLPEGEMVVLCDGPDGGGIAQVARTMPPYDAWEVWNVNIYPYAPIDRPNFLVAPDAGRYVVARKSAGAARSRVCLYRLDRDELLPALELPSAATDRTGQDMGYAGMVWHEGQLWVTYHSGHEAKATGKKACVYLARIRLPAAAGRP